MTLIGSDVFFAVWVPLLWVVGVCCGLTFFRRRLMQPLKVRMPRLTLSAAAILLLCASFLPFQRLPEYSGGLLALHYVVLLGFASSLLAVRLWTVVFAFGLGHERATNAGTGWFLRHRGMASGRARVLLGVVLCVVKVVVFVVLTGTLEDSWRLPVLVDPSRPIIDIVGSVLVLIYAIFFVSCASKLREWGPSSFFLAQEHFLLGGFAIVSVIIYLSLVSTNEFEGAQVVAILACGFVFITLLIFPLVKMKLGGPFPGFSYQRALSPRAFDDLNLDSPPETLLAFLSKPSNKKMFEDFLASEFSLENMQFLDAIEKYKAEFKDTTNLPSVLTAARKLYAEFFNEGSASQVSVASNMSRITVHAMNEASKRVESGDATVLSELICLFDAAGKLVFTHLSSDAFPRFLQSPIFTELQEEREFAPLLFAPGVRPWTSWIAKSSVESKEERGRSRLEAARQLSQTDLPNKLSAIQLATG